MAEEAEALMPWWTVPVGVALGVALPVLTLSGMFWLGGEDWRFWRGMAR